LHPSERRGRTTKIKRIPLAAEKKTTRATTHAIFCAQAQGEEQEERIRTRFTAMFAISRENNIPDAP